MHYFDYQLPVPNIPGQLARTLVLSFTRPFLSPPARSAFRKGLAYQDYSQPASLHCQWSGCGLNFHGHTHFPPPNNGVGTHLYAGWGVQFKTWGSKHVLSTTAQLIIWLWIPLQHTIVLSWRIGCVHNTFLFGARPDLLTSWEDNSGHKC